MKRTPNKAKPATDAARYAQLIEDLNRVSPMLEQAVAMLDVLEIAAPHADSLLDTTLESYCLACRALVADARNILNGPAQA